MPRATLRNRILAASGILGFVGAIVIFDLGCPGGTADSSQEPIDHLVLEPQVASVRVGGSVRFTVSVYDAHNALITDREVTWASIDPTIATVSGDKVSGVATGVRPGTVVIEAHAGGRHGSAELTVNNAPVASILVAGASTVAEFSSTPFTATVTDADHNILTGRSVEWRSSDPTIASVSSSGEVTGIKAGGPVSIIATAEFVSGSAPITVIGPPVARIEISAPTTQLTVGQSTQFQALALDASSHTLIGRLITWSSSSPATASVNGTGLVTANAPGSATITATSEGKSGSLGVDVSNATAFVAGRVVNYVTGQGIGGAAVSFRSNDAVGSSLIGATTAAADGSFTSPGFSTGISNGLLVEASASGFVTGRILVGSVPGGTTTYAGDVPLVPSSGMTGGISGVVKNARTAAGISGATVSLFNNVSATAVATQVSTGSGTFTFTSLAAGTYRLTASATGFQEVQRVGVAVGDGGVTANQDLVLSPSGTNAVTVVLTWGASPGDLDSHLTGPNPDGSRFHVYYSSRGSLTGAPFANLDVDDVSSFGPETITITQMSSGTYRYSVHDFTNRSSTSSNGLGSSGAKVQVYTAAGLAQTFFVPGQAGTLWTVFELSGTLASPVIAAKNIMSYASEPSAITAPPVASGFGITDGGLIGSAVRQHPKGKPR